MNIIIDGKVVSKEEALRILTRSLEVGDEKQLDTTVELKIVGKDDSGLPYKIEIVCNGVEMGTWFTEEDAFKLFNI